MFERVCIIMLANIVFFAKTVCYKYTSDDIPVMNNTKEAKHPWWKLRILQIEGGARVDSQQDHFLTTLIHGLVAVFIYVTFGSNDISFIAALLFSFNPINNQGSVWISGRTYAITALMLMVSIKYPMASPLSIAWLMYYPVGFVMSSILVVVDPMYLICIIPLGILHSFRFRKLLRNKTDKSSMFDEDRRVTPLKLILVIKTLSFYTIHAIFPIKTTFYHSFMQSLAGAGTKRAYSLDRFFWLGIPIIGAMIYKVFYTPWDVMSLGICWWVIGLAPYLNAFRVSQEIAERYAYAPLVGLMVVLASILHGYPVLVAVFVSMYATKMWFWMDAFHDDFYLVEMSCMAAPDAWYGWHIRALKRWDVGSHKEAMIFWTMARRISPREFKVLFNLATMLKMYKHDAEANQFMDEAERNIPKGMEPQIRPIITAWKHGKYKVLV